jgi:hypothetical protein
LTDRRIGGLRATQIGGLSATQIGELEATRIGGSATRRLFGVRFEENRRFDRFSSEVKNLLEVFDRPLEPDGTELFEGAFAGDEFWFCHEERHLVMD